MPPKDLRPLTSTLTDSEATCETKLCRINHPRGTCYMPMSYSHSGNRATSVTIAILKTHPSEIGCENTGNSEHFQLIYHIIASSSVGLCLSRLERLAHLIAS